MMKHLSLCSLLTMSMLLGVLTPAFAYLDKVPYIDTGLGFKYYQWAFLSDPKTSGSEIELKDTTVTEFVSGTDMLITLETLYYVFSMNSHLEEISAMHFADTIYNAYHDVLRSFSSDTTIVAAVEASMYRTHDNAGGSAASVQIMQGGGYDWVSYNNLETGKKGHLIVTTQPTCDIKVLAPDYNFGVITMHSRMDIQLQVGSGFPFADRVADYTDKTMLVEVFDADSQKVADTTLYVNVHPDSTKMEYLATTQIPIDYINSPIYKVVVSGPLLAEPKITTCLVTVDTVHLQLAIENATFLSDSIAKMTQFAAVKQSLDSAIAVARPYLKYKIDQQDQIDAAVKDLNDVIDAALAAINQPASLPTMPVSSASVNKVMKEQQLYIQSGGHTYDVTGKAVRIK